MKYSNDCTRMFPSTMEHTHNGGPLDYNGAEKFTLPNNIAVIISLSKTIFTFLC